MAAQPGLMDVAMLKITMAAVSVFIVAGACHASELYIATVNTLTTSGKIGRDVIASTSQGVPLDECQLRKSEWLSQNEAAFAVLMSEARAQGMTAEMQVACQRK